MSAEFHPERVDLPVAWRPDPSLSYRGRHLRPLPDPDLEQPVDLPPPSRPPIVRNAFVGRDAQLRETVRRLSLPDARVVTLVGRSGVGKTRLASEVARRLGGGYPGGAVFVDFSQQTGRSVVGQVASALAIPVAAGQPVADAVARHLHFSPALLVADDIDTVDGAPDVLLELARDSPGTRILATAQRPTGHAEEHVVRLRPLPVPSADADTAAIKASPAVSLYLARVSAADPDRPTSDADIPLIAELCRRLDGLPLAIELGAARARLMSPAGQLRALEAGDALDLRSARGDRRPARHQDLRSAIETTWAMTEPDERAVLRRMAVFAGPPMLDHLQGVVTCDDLTAADVLDALTTLVDLGLVETEMEPGGDTHYHLLPTIRTFALEHLAESGEAEELGHRHADVWLGVCRGARRLTETARAATMARHAGDLAVALSFLESRGRIADALELASDLVMMWIRIGVSDTARATHARLLAAAESPETDIPDGVCARGLVAAAVLAIQAPDLATHQELVGPWLARAVELARRSGDPETLLYALEWTAAGVVLTGDVASAFAANVEGVEVARSLGWSETLTRFEYRQSMFSAAMGDLATAVAAGGSALRRARANVDPESIVRVGLHLYWFPRDLPGMPPDVPPLEELLALAQRAGCLFEQSALYPHLAFARLVGGDVAGAARWCREGLEFATRYGAWHAVTFILISLLLVEGAVGDDVAVARLYGRIAPELATAQVSIAIPGAREQLMATIEGARVRLGDEAFAREAASTTQLDRDAVIEWAGGYASRLAGSTSESAPAPAPASAPESASASASAPGTAPAPAAAPAPSQTPAGQPTPSTNGTGHAQPPALTPRERQVLRELARGRTNREIGAALGLTEKTVMHHSVSIYAKLGVRGRAEATAWAVRNGFGDDASSR